jgi:predicted alpha/beta superfamily hydrolase
MKRLHGVRTTALVGLVGAASLSSISSLGLAQPQVEPIVIGESLTLHSDVLDEDRTVLVYEPTGYDRSDASYPVMYLLDGDTHFHHTTGIVEFLARNGYIPQMLVVGLPNTDRTRDLTPPTATDTAGAFPTAGSADAFLSFIVDELIPYVDGNYRTAPYRILVGHSFGGLFAVHTLLARPDVFDAYVAISPTLWWNGGSPISRAETFFEEHPDSDPFLFMTMGNEGGRMLSSVREFSAVLEERAPDSFEWEFALMDEETHGSIPHRTIYRAMERLYDGWRIPNFAELVERGGLGAVDRHFAEMSRKYGYEIETPENLFNQVGYWFLGQGRIDEAIAAFERNVQIYPGSANVYDSLGDAFDAAGQLERARASYAKAVELAEAADHPGLAVYRANLERIREKIGSR